MRQKLREKEGKFGFFKSGSVEILLKKVKILPKIYLIFTDGGHSSATVKNGLESSRSLMHDETAVLFHNYNFSGFKRVVDNISREDNQVKIIHPSSDYDMEFTKKKAWDQRFYFTMRAQSNSECI